MSILSNTNKARLAFLFTLLVLILVLVSCSIIVIVLYTNNTKLSNDYATLATEKQSSGDDLTSQISDLEDEVDTLTEANDALQSQIDDYEAKQATIKAYNDVHKYAYDVIMAHGAFAVNEQEYNTARAMAVAIGDQTLIDAIDSVWYDTHLPQATRLANFMNAIIQGIYSNLE
jgi:hypothetical protein